MKKKINFSHQRNTLAEIWNGPDVSHTLPPSIWYYLNYETTTSTQKSLRKRLVESWTVFGQIQNNKNEKPVYFGSGGKYSAEELKIRADMYDQIESFIYLMKQDLTLLSIEFEKLTTS